MVRQIPHEALQRMRRILLLVCTLAWLAGCGVKGPLTLPPAAPAATPAAPATGGGAATGAAPATTPPAERKP